MNELHLVKVSRTSERFICVNGRVRMTDQFIKLLRQLVGEPAISYDELFYTQDYDWFCPTLSLLEPLDVYNFYIRDAEKAMIFKLMAG